MLLEKQSNVSHQFPLPVDVVDESTRVTDVTGETVQLVVASTNVNDAGSAAGTIVFGRLANGGILDTIKSRIGRHSDTSFSWTTGTIFTSLVAFPFLEYERAVHRGDTRAQALAEAFANFSNGQYAIDHRTGTIIGKKATTGTSDTASYSYRSSLITSVGGSSGVADDSAFTVATTTVTPAGYFADETATDSVDENDIGAARMTLDRKQITASHYKEDSVFADQSYVDLVGGEVDDPTALATMTEGDIGNFKVDLSGRLIVTLGTTIAGEDLTNNLIGVLPKPIAGSTYTGTKVQDNSFTTLNLKASAGNVIYISVINTTGTVRYFQLHNTATTPGGGATAQEKWIVPANGQLVLGPNELGQAGIYFATGIAYANSTAAGTYTAGTAGDLLLDIRYV